MDMVKMTWMDMVDDPGEYDRYGMSGYGGCEQ